MGDALSEVKNSPRVLIPLADGVEEMEAVICIDVLRRAGWDVCAASLNTDMVTASRGVILGGDARLEDVLDQAWDIICIPGGAPGVQRLTGCAPLVERVQRQKLSGKWLAAICAGPMLLDRAEILSDMAFTCHPGVVEQFPGRIVSEDPVVIDGRVITSRGPGTAMAFALALIEALQGSAAAEAVSGPLCLP